MKFFYNQIGKKSGYLNLKKNRSDFFNQIKKYYVIMTPIYNFNHDSNLAEKVI